MHIIFVVEQLNTGGIGTSNLRWSAALIKAGHQVTLICQKQAGIYLEQVPVGVTLKILDAKRSVFSVLALRRELRADKEDKDTIIVSSAYTSIFAYFCKPKRLPLWLIIPNSPKENIDLAVKNGTLSRLSPSFWLYIIYGYVAKRAHFLSAVSKGVAQDAAKWLKLDKQDVAVLYNPACPINIPKNILAPHAWLTDKKCNTYIACGRLALSKNFSHLITAFIGAHQKDSSLRLLILGEGSFRSELQNQIDAAYLNSAPILLLGNCPNPLDYFAHARAYISSSQIEAFGNTLVEALAVGTPIIATDCPHGPREILDNGNYGQLIPIYDVDTLQATLIDFTPISTVEERKKRAQEFSASALLPIFLEQMAAATR